MHPNVSYTLPGGGPPWGGIAGIVICILLLMLGIRLFAGALDTDRVAAYIRSLGGRLLKRSWEPFGPGWLGQRHSRIYQIVYEDRAGRIHRAYVKTSLFSGVYLTEDSVVSEQEAEAIRSGLEGEAVGDGQMHSHGGGENREQAGGGLQCGPCVESVFPAAEESAPAAAEPDRAALLAENTRLRARIAALETRGPAEHPPE